MKPSFEVSETRLPANKRRKSKCVRTARGAGAQAYAPENAQAQNQRKGSRRRIPEYEILPCISSGMEAVRGGVIQSSACMRAPLARRLDERMYVALVNERARVLENECVGPNLHVATLSSPAIAAGIEPGQFVHMKIPGMDDHVLRRPFSVYARDAEAGVLEILYQVVGFGSARMTELAAGAEGVELIGPVGRAWQPPAEAKRALLVGGGVGAAPLFMLCEALVKNGVRTDVVLGAQTETALACRGRYEALLAEPPRCATDDGSFGREGFCTSLVQEAIEEAARAGEPYGYVAVCGPEPLMKIVAGMADGADIFCELSMERRMACGIGACLSCVVDTVEGKKRACVDGPVFKAQEVVWA